MSIDEQIKEIEMDQSKLRKLMDSTAIGGVIISQGLFRKPLFVQGTPPSIFAMEAYHDMEVRIQELKLEQIKKQRIKQ